MAATGTPTLEATKSWHERAASIRGGKTPEEIAAENGTSEAEEMTLLEAAATVLGADKPFCIAGKSFSLREPTLKQIKKFLLPAASGLKDKLSPYSTPSDVVQLLQASDQFQALMLDCIDFAKGDRPDNVMDWADSLPATQALELVNAFVDGISWSALVEQAKALMGKIKGLPKAGPA